MLQTADLQFRILLLRGQIIVRQVVLYALFLLGAAAAATAAVVLLSIVGFRALAAQVGTQWTMLILAAAYLVAAIVLWRVAQWILRKDGPKTDHTSPTDSADPRSPTPWRTDHGGKP